MKAISVFFSLALSIFCAQHVFAQIGGALTDRSDNLARIGKLKNFSSNQLPPSRFCIGFGALDRKVFDPEKAYDIIASSGVKNARCQTGWARTETKKGVYDFKWIDDVVDNLRARGIQPWFNVGYGNPLYMGKTDNPTAVGHVPLYYGEECLQAWKNYVRALAEHFKGRVFDYEIWNEPNIKKFWQPEKVSPEDYARFVKLSADEIRKADPNARVGACKAGGFDNYFTSLMRAPGAREIEFFCFHEYSGLPETDFPRSVRAARAFLKSIGSKAKIHQGESGYPAYIPKNCWFAPHAWHSSSEDIQAKWLLRRYVSDLSLDLERTSYLMIIDFNSNYSVAGGKGYDEAVWGLMENAPRYKVRKALGVSKNFFALFDGNVKPAEYHFSVSLDTPYPKKAHVSRLNLVAASLVSKSFDRNGWAMYAYYIPEDLQLQSPPIEGADLLITGSDAPKPLKEPVLVDMMTGAVYSLSRGGRNLPITDYPLVLTSREAIADIIDFGK